MQLSIMWFGLMMFLCRYPCCSVWGCGGSSVASGGCSHCGHHNTATDEEAKKTVCRANVAS